MDQKGHLIDQKGLKMYEQRQKMEFLDLIHLLLSGIGGYPPLNGKSFSLLRRLDKKYTTTDGSSGNLSISYIMTLMVALFSFSFPLLRLSCRQRK